MIRILFISALIIFSIPSNGSAKSKPRKSIRKRSSKVVRHPIKRKRSLKKRSIKGTWKKKKRKSIKLLKRQRYTSRSFQKIRKDKRKIKTNRRKRRKRRFNRFPAMPVYRIHTQEFASIKLYDKNGNIRKKALRKFNTVVRCYRKGITIPINYKVVVEIYQAWLYFGMPQVTVFSGCRQPPHASRESRHVKGNAIDFNFDGIPRRSLANYFLKRTRQISSYQLGVGYYPESFHVHLDVRKRHAFWVQLIDHNGKGYYASNAYAQFYRKKSTRVAFRKAKVTTKLSKK
jgi:uncharacterized protein YcbK (DUF882 family)